MSSAPFEAGPVSAIVALPCAAARVCATLGASDGGASTISPTSGALVSTALTGLALGKAHAMTAKPSSLAKLQKKDAETSRALTAGLSRLGITSHAAATR